MTDREIRNVETLGRADDAMVLAQLHSAADRFNMLAAELAARGLVVRLDVQDCPHVDGGEHPVLRVSALAYLRAKNL